MAVNHFIQMNNITEEPGDSEDNEKSELVGFTHYDKSQDYYTNWALREKILTDILDSLEQPEDYIKHLMIMPQHDIASNLNF